MSPPTSIILLTIDCWRHDHFSPSHTPYLTQLAQQSTHFTHAYSNAGWTLPALTTLFSGHYASRHYRPNVKDWLDPTIPLLSEQLQAHGYQTAGFSTNNWCGTTTHFNRGFHHFIDYRPDGPQLAPLQEKIYATTGWRKKALQTLLRHPLTHRLNPQLQPVMGVSAPELTNDALAWLRHHETQPVFLWAHYMDAHWPYAGSRRHSSPHERAQQWHDRFAMQKVEEWQATLHPGRARLSRWQTLYHEELFTLDRQIQRLLAYLRTRPDYPNTLLIIVGDHGEEFYEHGRFGHAYNQLYQESTRVPLLIYNGTNTGQNNQLVSLLDLAPTILASANITPAMPLPGRDILHPFPNTPLHSEMFGLQNAARYRLAIRTPQHTYIHDIDTPFQNQLYHHQTDPQEQHNHYHKQTPLSRQFDKMRFAHMSSIIPSLFTIDNKVQNLLANMEPALIQRLRALGYVT